MATNRRRRRGGVYAVVLDSKVGRLVFRFRCKDLFSDDEPAAPAPLVMRPVAYFPRGDYNVFHSFAVSGEHILGVSPLGATVVVHDGTGATRAGPELGATRSQPIGLPVGDDMVLVMAYRPLPGRSNFAEMRRRLERRPCSIAALGPDEYHNPMRHVTAYMTIGRRTWVSMVGVGTFSLDAGAVATRGGAAAWRKEGSWELPLHGRALYVRELGAAIGLGRGAGPYGGVVLCLCSCDVEARPPVIRHTWNETFPVECLPAGHSLDGSSGDLAYFGEGRFCISWSAAVENLHPEINGVATPTRSTLITLAVRLRRSADGELQLTMRGKLRHHLTSPSPHGKRGYLLQPYIS